MESLQKVIGNALLGKAVLKPHICKFCQMDLLNDRDQFFGACWACRVEDNLPAYDDDEDVHGRWMLGDEEKFGE